jgi:hypothetical protein
MRPTVILETHHVGNCEEFSCTDNNIQSYNENEGRREGTIEQIA